MNPIAAISFLTLYRRSALGTSPKKGTGNREQGTVRNKQFPLFVGIPFSVSQELPHK
jgi:hypothetical protein